MVISKRATQLMAFVLTFAFVLMGLAYEPKQVQAADEKPAVEVLGATLRLDGVSGTQSLRFGIKISNASLAKDCGIVIEANGKQVTVGTDVEDGSGKKKHTEMYAIDKENDAVIYSAVVTGIPKESYGLKFEVKGYVVAVETGESEVKPTESAQVEKSVNGVVEVLQEKDPEIQIQEETGDLVRVKEDGAVQKLTSTDSVFNAGDVSSIVKTSFPVKLDTVNRYDKEKEGVVIDDAAGDSSTYFDLPNKVAVGEEVEITVEGTYTGDTGFRMWIGNGSQSYQLQQKMFAANFADGDFKETFTVKNDCGKDNGAYNDDPDKVLGTDPATKLSVKGTAYNKTNINGLTIKSITVNYVDRTPDIAVDLSDSSSYVSEGNGRPGIKYDEGALNVDFGAYQGIAIMNPAADDIISNYKWVTLTYTSTEATKDFKAYVFDNETDVSKGTEKGTISSSADEQSVSFEAKTSMNGLKLFNYTGNGSSKISIKSIVFSHKEPEKPVTAPPYYKVDFEKDTKFESGSAATQKVQGDGSAKLTFGAFKGVFYFLPDTDEIKISDFKHLYIKYISTVSNTGFGRTGVSVYLPTKSELGTIEEFKSNSSEQSVKLTQEETLAHYSSSDVPIRAVQIFAYGDDVQGKLNIKSIIFSKNELTDEEIAEITGDSYPVVTEFDTPIGFMDDNESAAGTVVDITYDSTAIKDGEVVQRKAKVALPKGYSADKKYPVVYMLHGIGENETTLCERKAQNIFWNAAATGAAKDMIAVFPNVCANETGKPPRDENGNEKFFSLEHYAAYDNFVNDLEQCLMPYINDHYSTLTDRENTAICGFSMGGREALYIGTVKAEYFGYVGGFCPAYGLFEYPPNFTGVGEAGLFKSKADFKPADGYADNTFILIVKGKHDGTVGDQPYLYHSVLEENNIPHLYYETLGGDLVDVGDGGHGEMVYEHGLYNFITRMSKSE